MATSFSNDLNLHMFVCVGNNGAPVPAQHGLIASYILSTVFYKPASDMHAAMIYKLIRCASSSRKIITVSLAPAAAVDTATAVLCEEASGLGWHYDGHAEMQYNT